MQKISLIDLVEKGEIASTGQEVRLPTKLPNVNATMLPTYRIPLKYLYYNDDNGRVASIFHPELAPARDDEDSYYNKFMEDAIAENNPSKLQTTKKSIREKGQEVFGYILQDGRVIDGNRRYTALRQLQAESGQTQYFEAVILPLTWETKANRSAIKRLELALQHGQEEKLAYDSLDLSIDMYQTIEVNQDLSVEDYARDAGKKPSEIERRIEAVKITSDFLDLINADRNNYQIIKDLKMFAAIEDSTKKLISEFPKRGPKYEKAKEQLFTYMLTRIHAGVGGGQSLRDDNRNFIDTVIKSGQQDRFGDVTESVTDNILDNLGNEKIKLSGELQQNLDKVSDDLREFQKEYKTLNQRQNRSKNVDSFLSNINDIVRTLNDLVKENGLSGQLIYTNFSRDQIIGLRDSMIQVKDLGQKLSEIYGNEL